MAEGYEARDYEAVAGVVAGWTPSPLPSSNWRGVVAPNRRLSPAAQPSGDVARPTIVCTWRIEYTSLEGTFDEEDDDPLRHGDAIFRVSVDIGAGEGFGKLIFGQLRLLFAADTVQALTWFHETARPQSLGIRGDWWVEELRLPFIGGAG